MKTKLVILIIIMGFAGMIAFFPLKLGNDCTCLGQRCMNDDMGTSVFVEEEHAGYHRLLQNYMFPYAILWWGSIGTLVLGFYYLGKSRRSKEGKEYSCKSNLKGGV